LFWKRQKAKAQNLWFVENQINITGYILSLSLEEVNRDMNAATNNK